MKFKSLEIRRSIKHMVTEKDAGMGYSFSMALHTGEERRVIDDNRLQLSTYFGEKYKFCSIGQIHSDVVHVVKKYEQTGWRSLEEAVEADAVVSNVPYMVLTVLTADCVPVLLYDPVKHAIGAVHAGWQGTEKNILSKTIHKMQEVYGSKPEDIVVAIGPAIDRCCYEVGSEVGNIFINKYEQCIDRGVSKDKYQLDLKCINLLQAVECGVSTDNIEVSPICTACNSDRYFSYRKDKSSGRFVSAIGLRKQD